MDCRNEINHEYTDEIVCPFCGYIFSDSWEYESDCEDIGLLECRECEKSFYATRNITVDYSTEKARCGICKHCGNDDVVIENYNSSLGSYNDLCFKCGAIERERLIKVYFEELSSKTSEKTL